MKQISNQNKLDFARVFDVLHYQKIKYPNSKCINQWKESTWHSVSINDFVDRIDALTIKFIQFGLQKGDHAVIIPESGSYEWMLIDFALMQLGVIVIPLHPTLSADEIENLYTQIQPKMIIALNADLALKWNSVTGNVCFHLDMDSPGFLTLLSDLHFIHTLSGILEESKSLVHEDDICTILYTSGSTGITKGVMLTHKNIVHNIRAMLTIVPLEPSHKVISFLPFSHIFERTTTYAYFAFGVAIYFNTNKERFAHDFRSVRPDFCTAVPRVLEKMYDHVDQFLWRKSFFTKKIIQWALCIGEKYDVNKSHNFIYHTQLKIARVLVLDRWRIALGGKLKWMAVGASALRPEISRLFTAGRIRIIEGYGMTEMAPLISINRLEPGMYKLGSVGIPVLGVQVKIDNPDQNNHGEIWVKGPNLMKGYFKNPEMTKSVITENGWLKTGDIGYLSENKFLYVTDRIKDIFKTSAGKYISPLPLQMHFEQSSFIQRCLILGFQKPYVSALIVPNFELLEDWCKNEAIHYTSPEYMVHNVKIKDLFQSEMDRLNESIDTHERVRKFVLCHQDWSVENKEMTFTLKPIRHLLMEHYQKAIDGMYEE